MVCRYWLGINSVIIEMEFFEFGVKVVYDIICKVGYWIVRNWVVCNI